MNKMVKVNYQLSPEGQKKLLSMGGDGKREQSFETAATERLIKMADISADGKLTLDVRITRPEYIIEITYPDTTGIREIDGNCHKKVIEGIRFQNYHPHSDTFDEPQTIESILKAYDENEKLFEEMQKAIPEKNAEFEADYLKRLQTVKAEYEKREAEKVAREAEKAAREKEKAEWIRQHGSDYLKDCLELGIKANLEYVVERAAIEFPGYTVDYANNAYWEEKFSPSQDALDELKRVRGLGANAEIVWLTRPAKVRNDDDEFEHEDEFEPCEAVVIRNFLGKYDLVQRIGDFAKFEGTDHIFVD